MLVIAHRGASGHAPENTLAAFRKARALGADGIECDVHACKTGEPVVIHDATLDRVTGRPGRVAEATLAALRALTPPDGDAILTLEEMLDETQGLHCFIELKDAQAALPAAQAVTARIRAGAAAERFWLIGFDHGVLQTVHAQYPDLQLGASFERLADGAIAKAHAWGAKAIIAQHSGLTRARVEEAQALGLKVTSWTANAPADIRRLADLGVDGIISDYPERVRALRSPGPHRG